MPLDLPPALAQLRTPACIRERCGRVLEAALAGDCAHFEVDLSRMPGVASRVAEITRARFPDLCVPPHSRFGHFDADGVPRLAEVTAGLSDLSARERARRLTELVVMSVLVDAGAGDAWSYRDVDGRAVTRSEGLAVASLRWAQSGALSEEGEAFRVDAARLRALSEDALVEAFQVRAENPLIGVAGRTALLRALGEAAQTHRDVFVGGRIGGLVDSLQAQAVGARLPAERVLDAVLDGLGAIWPGRLTRAGEPLGDVWPHPAAGGEGLDAGLVPFHKLSQWLTYSLLLPLAEAGLEVTQLDALTGLSEYRNGGLFLDGGVLALRRPDAQHETHDAAGELVVEWRALTVALLDRLLPLVRESLGVTPEALPLAAMLEGGTWMAGRALAQERRADGSPPLKLASDGTLF